MWKRLSAGLVTALLVASCGGSGGGGDSGSSGTTTGTGTTPPPTVLPNTLAVSVDAGPAALTSANAVAANVLYATVTVCTPGSTTACRAIDHVQVDTGSTGLRLIASAVGSGVTPTAVTDPTTGRPLLECVQFADGYSFGSVVAVDVTLGSRTISSLPIQLIGDPSAGTAPSSCVSGPAENTAVDFGANGVLGIGNFLQDCGSACATRAVSGFYYTCPTTSGGSGCASAIVAVARQVPNPVARLSADNNGAIIQLPAVPSPGATGVTGQVLFGIGTQTDNALGSLRLFGLTGSGTLTATLNGATLTGSFVDSGSNGYFFPASNIATCPDASYFYCPVTASGTRTSITETATITGTNNATATVTFTVDNADQVFGNSSFTAFPGLAGPSGTLLNGTSGVLDFGLPFFYGRSVAVVFEGSTVAGVTGPALAF